MSYYYKNGKKKKKIKMRKIKNVDINDRLEKEAEQMAAGGLKNEMGRGVIAKKSSEISFCGPKD